MEKIPKSADQKNLENSAIFILSPQNQIYLNHWRYLGDCQTYLVERLCKNS